MLIDGEKWACESCVKGHRVSGCNHRDRDLIRIAPKGRPVKQCEHCRGARKSKSHHAKCDCGERKENSGLDVKLEEHSHHCACFQGSQCVCGLKSESVDPDLPPKPRSKARPGMSTAHSESTLMVFANGHHKPCHRSNNLAHTSGVPYRIPRHAPSHSISSSHSTLPDKTRRVDTEGLMQRSVDDLTIADGQATALYGMSNGAQRSVDSLPLSRPNVNIGSDIFGFGSADLDFREPPPPLMQNANLGQSSTQEQSASDVSKINVWSEGLFSQPSMQLGEFQFSPVDDVTAAELDWVAMSQPSLDENELFGATDLPLTETGVGDVFVRPISHSGDSARFSAPGLTASSSGTQSEVGDSTFPTDLESMKQPPPKGSGAVPMREIPYGIDTSVMQNQFGVPSSAPVQDNRLSLDLSMLSQGPSTFASRHSHSTVPQSHELPMNFWSEYAKSRRPPSLHNLSNMTGSFNQTSMPFEDDSRSLAIPASIEETPDDMAWYSDLRTELEQHGGLSLNTTWLNTI